MDPQVQAEIEDGCRLAAVVDKLAWQAHMILGADVMIETPDQSSIWALGLFDWPGEFAARLSPCMLGDSMNKPTKVISLGIQLPSLNPDASGMLRRRLSPAGELVSSPCSLLAQSSRGSEYGVKGSCDLSTWNGSGVGTGHSFPVVGGIATPIGITSEYDDSGIRHVIHESHSD